MYLRLHLCRVATLIHGQLLDSCFLKVMAGKPCWAGTAIILYLQANRRTKSGRFQVPNSLNYQLRGFGTTMTSWPWVQSTCFLYHHIPQLFFFKLIYAVAYTTIFYICLFIYGWLGNPECSDLFLLEVNIILLFKAENGRPSALNDDFVTQGCHCLKYNYQIFIQIIQFK